MTIRKLFLLAFLAGCASTVSAYQFPTVDEQMASRCGKPEREVDKRICLDPVLKQKRRELVVAALDYLKFAHANNLSQAIEEYGTTAEAFNQRLQNNCAGFTTPCLSDLIDKRVAAVKGALQSLVKDEEAWAAFKRKQEASQKQAQETIAAIAQQRAQNLALQQAQQQQAQARAVAQPGATSAAPRPFSQLSPDEKLQSWAARIAAGGTMQCQGISRYVLSMGRQYGHTSQVVAKLLDDASRNNCI